MNAIPGGAAALPLPQLLHYSTQRPHLRLEPLQAPRRRAPCPNTHGRSGNEHETTFPQAEWARAGSDTPLLTSPALWWSRVLQHGKCRVSSNLSLAEPPQDAAGPRAGCRLRKPSKTRGGGFALALQRVKHLTRSHPGAPTPALPPPPPSPSAGRCQSRNLLISSSPRQPSACLDSWPSAAEPAGAGMCESHVSLLPTVGKCCSSELAAAALPRPGRAAGQTGAGARSPRRRRLFSRPLPCGCPASPQPCGWQRTSEPPTAAGAVGGMGKEGLLPCLLSPFPPTLLLVLFF